MEINIKNTINSLLTWIANHICTDITINQYKITIPVLFSSLSVIVTLNELCIIRTGFSAKLVTTPKVSGPSAMRSSTIRMRTIFILSPGDISINCGVESKSSPP